MFFLRRGQAPRTCWRRRAAAWDLCLWWSVYNYTSPSVPGFRARHARNKRYWSVWVPVQSLQAWISFRATWPQQCRGFWARHARNKRHCCACILHYSRLAIPPSTLSSWHTVWLIGKGVPLWEGRAQSCLIDWKVRAPWRRARPMLLDRLERACPCWSGRAQVCLIDWKGRAPVDQGAPRRVALVGTYWFSIQYPDGVVQVVSTRGVAVSIAGCRLKSRLSRIFFYRQPSRQASTTCPLSYAETAELLDAVFSTAGSFHELM